MKKRKLLLKLEKLLQVLVARRDNLQIKLDKIDSMPLGTETRLDTNLWHKTFCQIKHIENRIATIQTEMEILANRRDKVRDVISEGKAIFNSIFSVNVGVK